MHALTLRTRMKVVIVGAGLSGLSTAMVLRKNIQFKDKQPLKIKIHVEIDPHDSSR